MVKSVEGVYRDGKVELLEAAPAVTESRVIVTCLSAGGMIDLAARGISPGHAADLRARLTTFEGDWDSPEMDIYDAL
jgi:hypothetical protein